MTSLGSSVNKDDRLEKDRAREDPFYLLESGKLWIKTKDASLIPLVLNDDQKLILKTIKNIQAQGKPVRIWILKARQKGCSTLCEGIIYSHTSQRENMSALIVSDDIEGSNYLFEMSKLYQEKLEENEPHLAPELKRSNEKKLEFAKIHSLIRIDSAMSARMIIDGKKTSRVGRKLTLQLIHLSEVAYFPALKSLLIGLLQSVPKLPNTIIIGETTANGLGGDFYEEWQRAKRGESDWYPLFIPWFTSVEYSMPLEPGEVLELDEEEKRLKEKYSITDEQLKWRRNTIRNECQGDVEIFKQEYPADDQEAFLSSGRPAFNVQVLREYLDKASEPIAIGNLHLKERKIEFEENHKGVLKVWEMPEPGKQYVIGADVAEGLIRRDYSTAIVLDRSSMCQVAEWHGHIDPDLFGVELYKIGRFYNMAFLGVEFNNHGLTTLTTLINGHSLYKTEPYRNLYFKEVLDEQSQRKTKKFGWKTDLKSKPLMIDDLGKAIRERLIGLVSKDLIDECLTYVVLEDGKTGGQGGCFDDRVIACAIAIQMYQQRHDLVFPDIF